MRCRKIKYTPALGERICALLAEGQTVRRVCAARGMPAPVTLLKWARERSDFRPMYLAAMGPRAVGSHGHRPVGQAVWNNGRPTVYSAQLAEAICARIEAGASLQDLRDARRLPSNRAIYDWLARNEDFRLMYEAACHVRGEALADEALAIADDTSGDMKPDEHGRLVYDPTSVPRAKLMIRMRQWRYGQLTLRKYGWR